MITNGTRRRTPSLRGWLIATFWMVATLSACGQGGGSGNGGAGLAPAPSDPDSVVLTPEQRAALAGPDADGNGVRDDIDAWIARQFPQSAKARAVWANEARVQQQVVLATSKAESRALSQKISDSVGCTWKVLEPLGWTGTQLQATGKELIALLLDNADRLRAFDRAENWASGTMTERRVGQIPLAELCGFDPASLPN